MKLSYNILERELDAVRKERDRLASLLDKKQEHAENQTALGDSEQRFRSLFQKAPLSYQSLDEDGNFIEVNETWLKVMGYGRNEVIGHNFSEFLHPDWKEHFKENFPRFKAVGEILGVEFEMLKRDGTKILVSFHGKIGKGKMIFSSKRTVFFKTLHQQENWSVLLKKLTKTCNLPRRWQGLATGH